MKVYYNGQYKIIDKTGKETIYKRLDEVPDYKYTITEVEVEKGTEIIKRDAFNGCFMLTNITIPNGVKCIEWGVFDKCSLLHNIELPDSLEYIGPEAFAGSGIETINLPNNMTNIDEAAFSNCSRLEKVELPENITEIKKNVFEFCNSLKEIILPDSITKIENNAFYSCESLEQIKLSENLKEIGIESFKKCSSLKEIEMPNSVEKIGESAFEKCRNLKKAILFNNITTIESLTFNDCDNLKIVMLGTKLEETKSAAFKNCKSLKTILFPTSLKSIGNFTFVNCEKLEKIYIPPNCSQIFAGAFKNCSSIQKIKLPKNLKFLASDAFEHCISLTSIILPDNEEVLGDNQFESCPNLKEIFYQEKNIKEILDLGFKNRNLYKVINRMIKNNLYLPDFECSELFKNETVEKIKEFNDDVLFLYCFNKAKNISDLEKVVPKYMIYKHIYNADLDIISNKEYIKRILSVGRSPFAYNLPGPFIDLYKKDKEIMLLCMKNARPASIEESEVICNEFNINIDNSELIQEILAINPKFYGIANPIDKEVFLDAALDDIINIHYNVNINPTGRKELIDIIETSICDIKVDNINHEYGIFTEGQYSNLYKIKGPNDKIKIEHAILNFKQKEKEIHKEEEK